jgi:hypothetical protein
MRPASVVFGLKAGASNDSRVQPTHADALDEMTLARPGVASGGLSVRTATTLYRITKR